MEIPDLVKLNLDRAIKFASLKDGLGVIPATRKSDGEQAFLLVLIKQDDDGTVHTLGIAEVLQVPFAELYDPPEGTVAMPECWDIVKEPEAKAKPEEATDVEDQTRH